MASISNNTTTGTLEVFAIAGRKLRNTEFFGKMDPYLTFRWRHLKRQTKAHVGGGRNPSWNQRALLSINPTTKATVIQKDSSEVEDEDDNVFSDADANDLMLIVQCFDKDLIKDDLIGQVTIDIKDLISENSGGTLDQWFPLIHPHKNKSAGEIRLVLTFHPDDHQLDIDNYHQANDNNNLKNDPYYTTKDIHVSSKDILNNDKPNSNSDISYKNNNQIHPLEIQGEMFKPPSISDNSGEHSDGLPIKNEAYGPYRPIMYDRKIGSGISPPPLVSSSMNQSNSVNSNVGRPKRPPPPIPIPTQSNTNSNYAYNVEPSPIVVRSRKSSTIDPSVLEITVARPLPSTPNNDNDNDNGNNGLVENENSSTNNSDVIGTNYITQTTYPERPPMATPAKDE